MKTRLYIVASALVLAMAILGIGRNVGASAAPAPPSISSLSPSSANAGSAALTIEVTGSGFASGAVVRWNGQTLGAPYVISSTRVRASVDAAKLSSAGSANVTVVNPNPNPGVSNGKPFTITPKAGGGNCTEPPSPYSLVATSTSAGNVSLKWSYSAGRCTTGFQVWEGASPSFGEAHLIGSPAVPPFPVNSLPAGRTNFWVYATGPGGRSLSAATTSVTILPPPAPVIVNLGCTPSAVTVGQAVTCTPTITGAVTSRSWSASGGTLSSTAGPTASVTFRAAGSASIALSACNGANCSPAKSQPITVAKPKTVVTMQVAGIILPGATACVPTASRTVLTLPPVGLSLRFDYGNALSHCPEGQSGSDDTGQSIWDSARHLNDQLKLRTANYDVTRVFIVGHSLGGAIAMAWAADFGKQWQDVTVVTLDSPINGCASLPAIPTAALSLVLPVLKVVPPAGTVFCAVNAAFPKGSSAGRDLFDATSVAKLKAARSTVNSYHASNSLDAVVTPWMAFPFELAGTNRALLFTDVGDAPWFHGSVLNDPTVRAWLARILGS